MTRFDGGSAKAPTGESALLCAAAATACLALTLAGCTSQEQHGATQPAQSHQVAQSVAQALHLGYSSRDFVGRWTCTVTNGKYTVVTTSTIRSDGTTVGSGTAYGHTTPTYENSWSYVAKGPTTGTMSDNNMAFAPPHFSATAAVKWQSPNRYTMVTMTDTPNVKAIGSRIDCARRH